MQILTAAWTLVAGGLTAAILYALVGFRRRSLRRSDLGFISDSWIAHQRAQSHDPGH
jgi:hypothetical protein